MKISKARREAVGGAAEILEDWHSGEKHQAEKRSVPPNESWI